MSELKLIDTKFIKPNPYNPRKEIDRGALGELVQSILEVGLLQPPTVYPEKGHYVVLCGERRVEACKALSMKEITCNVVSPPTDQAQALELALTENLLREDLKTSEEIMAIVELVQQGVRTERIAEVLGHGTDYVMTRYQIGQHPEVLKGFIAAGETNLGLWSLVGALETSGTRKNAIQVLKGDHYNTSLAADRLRVARRLEKLTAAKVATKLLTRWMRNYHNAKQKVNVCGDGNAGCKDCETLSYSVLDLLGWKYEGLGAWEVCLAGDETCYAYKQERQKTISEKLDLCTKANAIKETYGNYSTGWKTVNMAAAGCGGKDCKKCKSCYKVPDAFRFEHVEGTCNYRFNSPYLYCHAEDQTCYKKTLAAFKKKTKTATTGAKSLSKRTDDELKKELYKLVAGGNGQYYEAREHIKVLEKRGYKVTIKYDVEIVKPEASEEGAAA